MSSSVMESGVSFGTRNKTQGDDIVGASRGVALPYLTESLPVGLVGASTVAAFVLILDTIAGHPLGTPNLLGTALLRGEVIPLSAAIQPAIVFGYTLLHVAAFVVVSAAAVSAEFTLSRAGVSTGVQLALGATGLFLGLTGILGALLSLLGIDWVGNFGFDRLHLVNAIAALSMAITVHLRGEGRRLDRSAGRRG